MPVPDPYRKPIDVYGWSLQQANFSLHHDQTWKFEIPVVDFNGDPAPAGNPGAYIRLFIATADGDGTAYDEYEIYCDNDGTIGRTFDWDFVNTLALGTYVWSAYFRMGPTEGAAEMVGIGQFTVYPSIALGMIPFGP